MRIRCALVVLALGVAVTGGAAHAADDAAVARKDAATAYACMTARLKAKGADAEACIGQVSKGCAKAAGNKHDSTERDCARRESEAWQAVLADIQDRLAKRLDQSPNAKLTAMQEAWTTSRDRSCAFFYDYFDGTMAHPMIASCLNRETARRAIFLYGFLKDAEGA